MRIDDWHQAEVKKLRQTRDQIAARAVELAKMLGVDLDNPDKMSLLNSLAVLEVTGRNGPDTEGGRNVVE